MLSSCHRGSLARFSGCWFKLSLIKNNVSVFEILVTKRVARGVHGVLWLLLFAVCSYFCYFMSALSHFIVLYYIAVFNCIPVLNLV